MNEESPPKQENLWVQVGKFSQLAFILPAAIVVGWLGGGALDKWLHTSWLQTVGLILGIITGLVELIRTATSRFR